jgi:CubicO group peptidase (beta-lactamase class C family)
MERPAYSNVAFVLYMMAVEVATGKNYTQALKDYLTTPFRLQNTIASPGDSDKAVIPPVENTWGSDYGISTP